MIFFFSRGVKYQIINHRLYRDEGCLFPARCSGIEYFLNRIRNDIDNVELIINVRDWPQQSKYHSSESLPVFSFSKTQDYYDIMYPAWSFWDGGPAIKLYPRGLGQWDDHRKNLVKEATRIPWDKKLKKAFFRGSRTSNERDTLILLSRKNYSLVDAAYTKNQAWKSNKDTLGVPPVEELSLSEHCRYRYLFNFRGVAASFRFRHLFLCHSLVFHVGNEWQEFFYEALKPWVHYIPIPPDASEDTYRFLLRFFMEHDKLGFNIAKNGYDFVKTHLEIDDILCYWKLLLKNYIKLQTFEPTLDKGLIDVTK
ncbi:hypothetical protein AAG570_013217 [Ranatra chinensis]|uniref:Glycosyl transferase CAP10 domain-containing protein n=1 Tax=Ranatra chinensis TaxID=642074 RepID=A0ABD0YI38_9HEMI